MRPDIAKRMSNEQKKSILEQLLQHLGIITKPLKRSWADGRLPSFEHTQSDWASCLWALLLELLRGHFA